MPRTAAAAARVVLALLIPAAAAAGQESSSPPPAEPAEQQPAIPADEAKAPAIAPEQGDQTLTLLTPRFEVGQRVMLRQTSRKSKNGPMVVPTIVRVDVVERSDADLVLRWQVVKIETPPGLSRKEAREYQAHFASLKPPPIELLFREDWGLLGLRDWERARDDMMALTERLIRDMQEMKKDPEVMEKGLAGVRKLMSTKEGTEAILLKQVRAYFDGAYYEVMPGETVTEDIEAPNAFAGDGSMIPMKRTCSCSVDPDDPERVSVAIEVTLDPAVSGQLLQAMISRLTEGMELDREPPDMGEIEQRSETSWTLDRSIGWPVAVRMLSRAKFMNQVVEEEYTWTLIEGPTKPAP